MSWSKVTSGGLRAKPQKSRPLSEKGDQRYVLAMSRSSSKFKVIGQGHKIEVTIVGVWSIGGGSPKMVEFPPPPIELPEVQHVGVFI